MVISESAPRAHTGEGDPRSCTVCVGNMPYAFYKSHLGGEMSIANNPMTLLYKPSVTDPVWLAVLSFLKPAQFQLSKA